MVLLRPLEAATYAGPTDLVTPRSVLGSNATHLRTNWKTPVEVTTRWETEKVYSPVNSVEQRTARKIRPERSLRSSHLLFGADYEFGIQHVNRFVPRQGTPSQANLSTFGFGASVQTPLGCDSSKVTLVEASGPGHKVWCDTRWRRFYEGARVYLVPPTPTVFTVSSIRTNVMLGTIEEVNDDWLLITTPPVLPAQGWTVEPCMDMIPQISRPVLSVTGRVAELDLDAIEFGGVSALPGRSLPAGIQTHTGRDSVNRPVLIFPHNWQSSLDWEVVRDGQESGFANGGDLFAAGLRSRRRAEVQARFFSRETAWHFLSVFDAMQGRRGAFWAVFPNIVIDYLAVTPSSDFLVIPYQGDMLEWRFSVDAIAFELADGAWSIHELTTIADNMDGTWLLDNISPALPAVSEIRCVRWAARARFDSDELTESWTSIEVVDVAFPIIELSNPANLQMTAP